MESMKSVLSASVIDSTLNAFAITPI